MPQLDTDLVAAYDFALPDDLIAARPLQTRSGARMLVVDGDVRHDASVADLPRWLRPGDLVVVNDARVVQARLRGKRASGGAFELLVLGFGDEGRWDDADADIVAMVRVRRRLEVGERVWLHDGSALDVVAFEPGRARLAVVEGDGWSIMARTGEVPLPPYVERRRANERAAAAAAATVGDVGTGGPAPSAGGETREGTDGERYQTVFARNDGAIAAPTAGLHFDDVLVRAVAEAGAEIASVTLWVGLGTFQPVAHDRLSDHPMHAERYAISDAVARKLRETRAGGGRVVAVGTTVARSLEDAAQATGDVVAGTRATRLLIRPGFRWRCVDALFTNFHIPRSTLLALVASFGGYEPVMAAYAHAVARGYRFYSYGDAMFLSRRHVED